MTILTPTFTQALTNGGAGAPMHVLPSELQKDFVEQPEIVAKNTLPLKVALIGTAPSSRLLAPFNDPTWQIWACSPGNMNQLPRFDTWFELHSNLLWPEHESYGRPYIEWLKTVKQPIYMQDDVLVPNATRFPKDELVERFGDEFFTSSFAWMMALAIKLGAAEIALYGIDMASRDEYIRQRPGFYHFKREAMKHGIKVSAPHESDIMQSPPLYAYVDSTPFGRKIMARRSEVSGRVGGMTQQRDGLNNNITYLQGALEDLDYFESIWSGVCNDMGRLEYRNSQLETENAALKAKVAELMAPTLTVQPGLPMATFTSDPLINPSWTIGSGLSVAPLKRRRKRNQPEPAAPAGDDHG